MKIKVLEVDQWTSTGNIEDFTFADFELSKIKGGDSEAVQKLDVARAKIFEVEESVNPAIGRVWYREGAGGKLVRWRANYDSSD